MVDVEAAEAVYAAALERYESDRGDAARAAYKQAARELQAARAEGRNNAVTRVIVEE